MIKKIRLPNIDNFFIELQSENNESSSSKKVTYNISLHDAITEIRAKEPLMDIEDKKRTFDELLEICKKITNFVGLESMEASYINKFKSVLERYYVPYPSFEKSYFKIFRNDDRKLFQFFLNTLYELNAINNSPQKAFQAKANAIFKSEEFKKKIFKQNVGLKEYIIFLNSCFNADIKNYTNLSNGDNYSKDVYDYFERNFNSI